MVVVNSLLTVEIEDCLWIWAGSFYCILFDLFAGKAGMEALQKENALYKGYIATLEK